jgi:hypothetical protein
VVNWQRFTPVDFEYDFEHDELAAHHITFEETVECFFVNFEIRRNKSYRDRYQLLGRHWADDNSRSSSSSELGMWSALLPDGMYEREN